MRNVNVPNTYLMEPFESPCGSNEPGLAALVDRAWQNNTPAMTLEEVQRVGALDPVAYEIDTDIEGGKPVIYSLDNKEDGPKIMEIVGNFKVNPNPNPNRNTRALKHTRTFTDIHT